MNIKIKYGLIALSVIVIQSVIKFIGVIITGSLSFISETLDTFIDIFFIALTLYSVYVSQKPADYEHMFGHGKIDSIGALIQGIILVNIYGFLIFNAIQALINQDFIVENASLGLQILIVSFLLNLVVSRILIWQGKKNESLSLKMQGLNMFQDSLRALLVIVNFVVVIFCDIRYLDPIFGIILSGIIIISALKLAIDGIQELIDINPVNAVILEGLKKEIFNLEHVNGVRELRVRASSGKLFLNVNLTVEKHVSIVHADEISKSVRSMVEDYLANYNVETIIEMSSLGGEKALSEEIINIIYSLKQKYQNIYDITNLDVFQVEKEYFISLTIIVQNNLTLTKAHEVTTKFENHLKHQIPAISRIISHIEAIEKRKKVSSNGKKCKRLNSDELKKLKNEIEQILRSKPYVKGYHGFEFWNVYNYCIIEIHIFFDGDLNISTVHDLTSELEKSIRNKIEVPNLEEIILHSEPLTGRTDGVVFK